VVDGSCSRGAFLYFAMIDDMRRVMLLVESSMWVQGGGVLGLAQSRPS